MFVCLCVCLYVFVMVSWNENVHLLDEQVYAMLLFHDYLFTCTRDIHHDQLLLVGPLLNGTRYLPQSYGHSFTYKFMDLNIDASVQRIAGKLLDSMDHLI